jgi:hypothetical protein
MDGFDLVVLSACYAIEPKHIQPTREYISNGGGILLLKGAPCFFPEYNKDHWTTTDLSLIEDWFGARCYVNTRGDAIVAMDNPFGTTLANGTTLIEDVGPSAAAITQINETAEIVAEWETGETCAFAYEFGRGRVYYQAAYEVLQADGCQADVDITPNALNLKSQGKWITASIDLPEGYNITDVDITSIWLNRTVAAYVSPSGVSDDDGDGIPDLMVKFDRAAVVAYIQLNVNLTALAEQKFTVVTLTLTGALGDGTTFQGSDHIRVICPATKGAGPENRQFIR